MAVSEIVQTIYHQIKGGRLQVMIGAKNFTSGDNGMSLSFRFMPGRGKVNYCKIVYAPGFDLYDMEIGRIWTQNRTPRYDVKKFVQGVYFDQLMPIFEDFTGLATHL